MPTDEQKRRAAKLVADRMSERGWDDRHLAGEASVTIDTVRDFLSLKRWPQAAKRHAMEDALGLARNMIESVANGLYDPPEPTTAEDPVEAAIYRSALTRPNQLKLAGIYYEMLEAQNVGAAG